MRRTGPSYLCDVTGDVAALTLPSEAYQVDDDDDFDLPRGWVEVTIRRVVPNPEYGAAEQRVEQRRNAMLEMLGAQAQANGVPFDPESDLVADLLEREAPDHDEPVEILEERTLHVSARAVPQALAAFGIE